MQPEPTKRSGNVRIQGVDDRIAARSTATRDLQLLAVSFRSTNDEKKPKTWMNAERSRTPARVDMKKFVK